VDLPWLATVPEKFALAVAQADAAKRPARMSRRRGYCHSVGHNRRLRFKDGRQINTWLLHSGEDEVQCLGSAAPVDPEVGILCFDGDDGLPVAVLWQFTLHTNANFGPRFSADYPGVVAARLRERFGPRLVPIFLPGACADINPIARHRSVGDQLAEIIVRQLDGRKPRDGSVPLGALKREVVVPCRDLTVDQEKRIRDSQWNPESQEAFRRELEIMRKQGTREAKTVLQAWRIGDVGFASLPGELFVEWGLKIKAESPFPWTYPVELGADCLGYLVTHQAWRAGGYESLIARSARPSPEGVEAMVDSALAMLRELWAQGDAGA
jgi:neutral ceramidase